jgi:hypothetical protein
MVGREEKIIRSARWLCLLLMLSSAVVLQAQSSGAWQERACRPADGIQQAGEHRTERWFPLYQLHGHIEFLVDGTQRIEDNQKNYKLGYYGALFARFNFRRRFLQTEVSYQYRPCRSVARQG